ncbi:hypothetical protein ACL03H_12520 [Saccharopolyspora sp. MS10]|uniref:hypothetical protein n=1 Tax=Saccharopolyspora sp. MS10 TaxID=3385973 RepID=UPI0039A0F1E5
MATDEDAEHSDSAVEKCQRRTGSGDSSLARNSIDGSSIANSVQANAISGGVHFYGVNPTPIYVSQTESATGGGHKQEEAPEPETREPGLVAKYFDHVIKNRSPILVWSALMAPVNVTIVGITEYFAGAQSPGESPSTDLETAQAGAVFSALLAMLVAWRYIARRNGSEKWRSMREVHPSIVNFLRRRALAAMVILLSVLLVFSSIPTVMDPESLTTASSNSTSNQDQSGLSKFGFVIFIDLLLLELVVFCIKVNVRHYRAGESSPVE